VLEESVSPYLDKKKRPCCPIEAQSCYVDRENNRYGIVRDMVAPQDEINKRSSKLLHELSVRQLQESIPGAAMGVDIDDARKEAAKPDGVIPSGMVVVPRQDVVAGQAQLLQGATEALERFAPNPAILGRQGENQSGRANQIRQQAGMTEQAIIFGGIDEWETRVYRQMWCRGRQHWTAPMYVRVTEDEGAPSFLGINQPPEGGQPVPDPANPTQQLVQGEQPVFQMPNGEQVLGYENAIGELDIDIMIDRTPDTANLQQEQFQMLLELVPIYGPQEVPFDDVLEASTMPNKRKIIEKRKARAEQASQMQGPQQELAQRGAVAEVTKTEAEAALTIAKADNEVLKPQMEAMKAASQAERSPPPGL
jgi:rhodanese-related sulfurtransferase